MLWGCLKSRRSTGKEPSKEAKRGGRNCAESSNNMGRYSSCPRLLGEPHAESVRRVPNGIVYEKYVIAIQTPFSKDAWSETTCTLEVPEGSTIGPGGIPCTNPWSRAGVLALTHAGFYFPDFKGKVGVNSL